MVQNQRNEIPVEDTWDLTTIFKNDSDFEAAFNKVQELTSAASKYRSTMGADAEHFFGAIEASLKAFRLLETVYVYASMNNDLDTGNDKYQAYNARVNSLAAQVESALSFIQPEILSIDKKKIAEFLKENPAKEQYAHYLDFIEKKRPHVLNEEAEALISQVQDVLNTSAETFSVLSNNDLIFPSIIDEDGQKVRLTNGSYSLHIESYDRKVRKDAFKGMYQAYGDYKNTFAQTLSGQIKADNYLAKVHKYPDARSAAMATNNIPAIVYDNLVSAVHEHLDLLHRYVALRKKILQLDEMHMYDLYVPLLSEPPVEYNFEQAKKRARQALEIYGDEYLDAVDHIYNERMIDVYETKGKRSGGYSGGAYDTNPFILLNYQDTLDDVYTLIHETGHSVHSWLTRKYQPYVYGDYPIFVAEIASTTNENLLTDDFLANSDDPKLRAYILNHYLDGVKGTVFRQTQFAEFEHYLHTSEQNGIPITANGISEYYGKLNADYYGSSVVSDPEISLEWSRIPHFYYDYYVYQYATGFAAATTLSENMLSHQENAVDRYLGFLKSGNSQYPIETMKAAGVDMTKPDYLNKTFAVFEQRLNELESLIG
ncbi:oligoendopeptidase F [Xylocopilactobacillus apicola]|uniref:Oligopeptidase F n=1 Tax=Xylocopilactobacillus apicola TaxID=2932184 RepID=A0AAU9D080_9LACO|nr:oligoendopeptidase F [Xylocopilactobacillus apicola]BDR58101.1 oligoendopeptidase F [Xylocopilactobacillus apicola]